MTKHWERKGDTQALSKGKGDARALSKGKGDAHAPGKGKGDDQAPGKKRRCPTHRPLVYLQILKESF